MRATTAHPLSTAGRPSLLSESSTEQELATVLHGRLLHARLGQRSLCTGAPTRASEEVRHGGACHEAPRPCLEEARRVGHDSELFRRPTAGGGLGERLGKGGFPGAACRPGGEDKGAEDGFCGHSNIIARFLRFGSSLPRTIE
ncbi:unnamed protein product [Prorocentrum cordatum]|uniref:Uncharacterized protein n=1 Tax=Prorocentrum cordatum TaxID=2364126 RepID=A0ABN9SP92_9DINO|nr:unnamed protein product [Polarella glacialis]